jgi:hypothetical protein
LRVVDLTPRSSRRLKDGSEGLLQGHPRMSSYEVEVEQEPEAHGSN